MRPFGIYKRSNGVYYGFLVNPVTGKKLPARTTGSRNKQEAEFVVMGWRRDGSYPGQLLKQAVTVDMAISSVKSADWQAGDVRRLIEAMKRRGFIDSVRLAGGGPESEPFISYLEQFWTFDDSPYVRERLAFGHSCHRRHINDNYSRVKNHWKTYFSAEITIGEITRSHIEEFQLVLKDKGLAHKSINHVINAGRLPLSWLFKKGKIPTDPTEGLQQFAGDTKKRGILTTSELENLFKPDLWKSSVARVAALLASTTGLRLGEIRALQIQDIKLDRIIVHHSYSRLDGLKSPKNGDTREAPLLPHVREEILELIENNPNGNGPEVFVFYSLFAKGKCEPIGENTVNSNFKIAMENIEVDWRDRGISFHSLRHGYTTALAGRVGINALQGIVGHRDKAMTEHYSNHLNEENFLTVQKASVEAFKGVI